MAVCRAWRRLSRTAISVPNMPMWMWFAPKGFVRTPDGSRRMKAYSLLNLTSSTTQEPRQLPILYVEQFLCCRGGGLNLTVSGTKNSPYELSVPEEIMLHAIYNPFTGISFQLPSTFIDHEGKRGTMMRFEHTQISAEPPNCMVATSYEGCLCICRPGDNDWMKEHKEYTRVYDMIFYKDEVYCIVNDRVMAYNVTKIYENGNFSCEPWRDILFEWTDLYGAKSPYNKEHYLVESRGELLVVTLITSKKFPDDGNIEFTVHRIDQEVGRLVPVNDLGGERMLMVGQGCSVSWSMLNNDVAYELPEFFEKNCIYFYDYFDNSGTLGLGKYWLNKEEGVATKRKSFEVHPQYSFAGSKYWPVWFAPTYLN